ncbi:hypothetical protein J21TS3_53020 [Paenibacillus cookii]|uniref:Uncharacterized protein n=1 Tax=Paenibacillus cookii TaxID=157839 RepID=A0ABQ4M4P9_9BACL|nr:hypothetical protein J21TS3_53020 [Paenibacillus cookii]
MISVRLWPTSVNTILDASSQVIYKLKGPTREREYEPITDYQSFNLNFESTAH